MPPLPPGTVLAGRYALVRFVARGGMGEVYEALDRELKSRVAVKTVLAHLTGDPAVMERVRREVQLARAVTDPHVCRLFDLGHAEVAGRPVTFITMELLEGQSLRERLRDGPLSPEQALAFATDVAQGVEACHRAGVIHRDLKAENVLVVKRSDREHAVLSDFGIARLEDAAAAEARASTPTLTQEGHLIGSLAFVAPEQVDGGRATPKTDVYALGALLWELVVGPWPLRGKTTLEVVRTLATEASPAERLPASLGEHWKGVLSRCLARDPAQRFGSAQEVIDALYPEGPPRRVSSPSVRVTLPPGSKARAPRTRMLAGGAALVLAGLAAAGWWFAQRQPAAPARPAPPPADVLLARLQAHRERLEYAQARDVARQLQASGAGSLADFHLAVAQAGLGDWTEAEAAARRALAQQPPLGRRLVLQLEMLLERAEGRHDQALGFQEALYTTDATDPLAGLEYAEALMPRYKLDEAQVVLDAVAALRPSASLAARLALARALHAHTMARVLQADVDRHASAAAEAARKEGAVVLEGRARVLLASASLFQGRADQATAELDQALKLLTSASDDAFLSHAWRMRSILLISTGGGSTALGLEAVGKAIALARKVRDDVALALAQNVLGSILSNEAAFDETLAAYAESEAAALRAGREDIADTRARPNRATLLGDMGKMTEAIQLLEGLLARRPDVSGIEALNLARFNRAAGDRARARKYLEQMDATLKATQNEQNRWTFHMVLAELEFDAGNLSAARAQHRRAEMLLKAMGGTGVDPELSISRAVVALDTSPQSVAESLATALKSPELTLLQRATMQVLLGLALVRSGRREDALVQQQAWRDNARVYTQLADVNLYGRLLDAELAVGPDERQAASQALEKAARALRADGHLHGAWELELGWAQSLRREGKLAEATAALTKLKTEAAKAGDLRLAKAATAASK